MSKVRTRTARQAFMSKNPTWRRPWHKNGDIMLKAFFGKLKIRARRCRKYEIIEIRSFYSWSLTSHVHWLLIHSTVDCVSMKTYIKIRTVFLLHVRGRENSARHHIIATKSARLHLWQFGSKSYWSHVFSLIIEVMNWRGGRLRPRRSSAFLSSLLSTRPFCPSYQ